MNNLVVGSVVLSFVPAVLAGDLIGPTPYLSASDSPFQLAGENAYLETFEDLLLNVPGVTASNGAPFGPGGLTDSVDGDDGVIDGSGTNGRSFFYGGGASGVHFVFDAAELGGLPTQAGIVWTDGGGTITFTAYDEHGVEIGTLTGDHADGSISGTTAEDRFYGVTHAGGISEIWIRNSSGGIEVDHLQYVVGDVCRADLNQDGTLDFFDVQAFLNAFSSQQSIADFNNDTLFNFFDVQAFLSAFSTGCG